MIKVVIIGTGGHSKVVSDEISRLKNYKVVGYIDEMKKVGSKVNKFLKANILGKLDDLKKINKKHYQYFIAIGDNFRRKRVYEYILKKKIPIKWAKIISKDTIISKNSVISEGALIVSGSIINVNTHIGKHCIINTGSKIDHDNYFEDFSSCWTQCYDRGNVRVNQLSHLGIDTTIRHNIIIKDNTIVGAKSYVNKNCKSNSVYYGRVAKKIRDRKKGEKYL